MNRIQKHPNGLCKVDTNFQWKTCNLTLNSTGLVGYLCFKNDNWATELAQCVKVLAVLHKYTVQMAEICLESFQELLRILPKFQAKLHLMMFCETQVNNSNNNFKYQTF